MEHALRKIRKADAKEVKEFILSILLAEYPFDRAAYSDSDIEDIISSYGGERDSFFIVEESGRIVGTVGVKEDGRDEALIRRLFVAKDRRGAGYGSQLLRTAIDFCRSAKYTCAYFRCTDRMSSAMALCARHGFKEAESLAVSGFNIHRLMLAI